MQKFKNCLKNKQENFIVTFIFLAPSLLGFSVFYIIPFIVAGVYSFFDSSFGASFVALRNYMDLINNPVFRLSVKNTLVFTVISVPLSVFISLGLALILNGDVFFKSFFKTTFILPLAIPTASVALLWNMAFQNRGMVNGLLSRTALPTVNWFNSSWTIIVIVLMYIWKNAGYNMVLFLGGLNNIPKEYYEQAALEGAGKCWIFKNITLVYLTPVFFFVLIMSLLSSFKVFREVYLIAGVYPHESIYLLQHYMNNVFFTLDYQKLTSAAYLTAIFIYGLVYIILKLDKKFSQKIGI